MTSGIPIATCAPASPAPSTIPETLQEKAYAYVGDSLGGSYDPRPVLTVRSCGAVEATAGGCMPSAGTPCLGCADPGTPTTLCRF